MPALRGRGFVIRPKNLIGLLAAMLVLAADQASKAWILYVLDLPDLVSVKLLPVLDLTMVWNRGVTFGLLNGLGAIGPMILTVVAAVVVVALLLWLRKAETVMVAIALGAIAGGAVGNVIDRLRFGAVVDFLHAHAFGLSFPYVFNVADSAIVCGVGALLLDSLRSHRLPARASGAKEPS
jgi:signal peptidase II